MTTRLLLAASVFFAFCAQGQANELTLDRGSDTSNMAQVAITGDDNVISITQIAPGDAGMNAADGNRLDLVIEGDRNGGYEDASFGPELAEFSLEPGLFTQEGRGNAIEFSVSGNANLFAFNQTGNNNSAYGAMTGAGNQAIVQQTGNNNVAGFSQQGNGNIVSISQTSW